MKSFNLLRLAMVGGLGAAALFLSPVCKAQEVSSDHFTDTGVQGVYENAPVKPVTAKPKQTVQVQARRTNSPAVLEATERTPVIPAKGASKTASTKRKAAAAGSKKQ